MSRIFVRFDGGRKRCSVCETSFSIDEIVFELPSSCFRSTINYRYSHIKCMLDLQGVLPSDKKYSEIYKEWVKNKMIEEL